jgi:hypothetical protein
MEVSSGILWAVLMAELEVAFMLGLRDGYSAMPLWIYSKYPVCCLMEIEC